MSIDLRTPSWPGSYGDEAQPRMGFFTDTSVCIGCKACEVACKEWNMLPADAMGLTGMSYDNTGELGASTWRHVAFVEQDRPLRVPQDDDGDGADGLRWLMSSDVCKHCTRAACLEVCPTGALFRTELGTVVVQDDVCNGCGYCIPACPFGVIDKREDDGRAFKCTLCYDRTREGLTPACAQACPTESIQYGPLDELRERAEARLEAVRTEGFDGAHLYLNRPDDGIDGAGAFFLLLDEPEVYGLPPDPVAPTAEQRGAWLAAAAAGGRPRGRTGGGVRRDGGREQGQAGRGQGAAERAARRRRLLLRPADRQAAGLGARDRLVLLRRRPRGRLGLAGPGRTPGRERAAAPLGVPRGRGGDERLSAAPDQGSRAARAAFTTCCGCCGRRPR